jgi:hypothetical protein
MPIYYPDRHNTLRLYANLFTLPLHVLVILFNHYQLETQVYNLKIMQWFLILKFLLLYYVHYFRLPLQSRW